MEIGRVKQTYHRINTFIKKTPILQSEYLNELTHADLYFKCENLQRTGAFKFRGACSALSTLSDDQLKKGVVTHSSGNHGKALSKAADIFNAPAHVVVPENAPQPKVNGILENGGNVHFCEATLEAREKHAAYWVDHTAGLFIHPSNNLDVISGQGTVLLEIMTQVEELDQVICPVGGGGLLGGICMAAIEEDYSIEILAGEPASYDDAYRSLKSGKIETNQGGETLADGLKTNLGSNNFPWIQKRVHAIYPVQESTIAKAMSLLWNHLKIVVEPSSAVPMAAIIENPNAFKNKRVAIVLTGGNVDVSKFFSQLEA